MVAVGNLIGSAGFGLGLCELPDYGYQGIAWSTFVALLAGLQPVRHRYHLTAHPRLVAVGPACHALSLPGK
ncbi:MAG: hypothetical protein ACLSAH_05545 [Bilophila wadsworthia]